MALGGLMTHSVADIALSALFSAGQVTAYPNAWTGSAHGEPDDPDEAVTLYDQAGRRSDRDTHTNNYAEFYGLQVRVRSRTSHSGAYKAKLLRQFLLAWNGGNVTIAAKGGVPAATYKLNGFADVGDVLPIGREPQTGRFITTINMLVTAYQL